MTDHAADKPSKATTEGKEAADDLDVVFPDENARARSSRYTSQQRMPPSGQPNQIPSPYDDIDNMENLFDESQTEEVMLGAPSYGGANYTDNATGPNLPDNSAYDLAVDSGVDLGAVDSMLDTEPVAEAPSGGQKKPEDNPEFPDIFDTSNEGSPLGRGVDDHFERLHEDSPASGKRIQLTEDDYADRFFPGVDEEVSRETNPEESGRGVESEPSASRLPEEVAASSSLGAIKSRTNIGILLGLLGIVGSAAAVWMNLGTSDRVDRLETQRAVHAPVAKTQDQSAAIASLNRRLDELSGQFAAHMKQVAKMQAKPVSVERAAPAEKQAAAKPAAAVTTHEKPAIAAPEKKAVPKGHATTKPTVSVAKKSMQPPDASSAAKPVVAPKGSEWVVNLSSFSSPAAVNRRLAHLKKLGIQAESIKVTVHGRTWYRLRAIGYASEKEAREQLKVLEKKVGIKDAWIGVR